MSSKKSSGNKYMSKLQQLDQLYKNQIQTPRMKKSNSMIHSKYLQLQLQTSHKKKESLQKIMFQKDNRIQELELQVKEHKSLVLQTLQKWKRFNHQLQNKQKECSKLKIELEHIKQNQAKLTKQKLQKFMQSQQNNKVLTLQNISLKEQNKNLKVQLQKYKQSYLKVKQKRIQEKEQWKKVVPQFIREVQILKKQFSKMNPNT